MRKLTVWVFIHLLLFYSLFYVVGCNPVKELRDARVAAEKASNEAKMVLEKVKEYSEKAEAAAQRAEKAAASSEDFSKKAETASQKAVSSFEKHLKK